MLSKIEKLGQKIDSRLEGNGYIFSISRQYWKMAKDAVDTLRPFKKGEGVITELKQIVSAFVDLVKSAGLTGMCLMAIPSLPVTSLYYLVSGLIKGKSMSEIGEEIKGLLTISLEALISSALKTVRCLLKVATSPLALLRIPVRALITKFNKSNSNSNSSESLDANSFVHLHNPDHYSGVGSPDAEVVAPTVAFGVRRDSTAMLNAFGGASQPPALRQAESSPRVAGAPQVLQV